MCPVELELQTSMWVLGTEPGPPQEHPVLLLLHHLSSPRNVFRKCCFYQEVSPDPPPVSLHQTLLLLLPHHHPGCATHPKFTAPPKTEVREMEQAPDQGGTIRAEVRSLKEETPFCTHRPYCPPLAFSVPLGPYLGYSQSHSKNCSRTPMKSSFKEPVGGWAWWCNSVTPVLKFKASLGYIQYPVLSFNILLLFICACTHAQTYTCHRCRRKSEKGIGCPRTEATGNCEPANMGARN